MIPPTKPFHVFWAELLDDKLHVIWALTAIAIIAMLLTPEKSSTIVSNVVSGLLGVAVGKSVK